MPASLLAYFARTELRDGLMLLPTAALALGPGALPAYAIARRMRLSAAEALPAALAVSFALLGAASYLARWLGWSLEAAMALYALATVGAGLLAWRLRSGGEHLPRSPLAVALGAATCALALLEGAWLGFTGDVFFHLAAPRSLLVRHAPLVTDPLYGTNARLLDPVAGIEHTALAMWSRATGLDVLAFWAPFGALAAGLFALAFFALVRTAAHSERAAFFATLAYLATTGFDFRNFAYPNTASRLLVFVALAALVRLAAEPKLAPFLLAVAAALAGGWMHLATAQILFVLVWLIAALVGLGGWLRRRETSAQPSLAALLGTAAVIGAFATASVYERSRVALHGFMLAPAAYDLGRSHLVVARAFLFPRAVLPARLASLETLATLAMAALVLGMLGWLARETLRRGDAESWATLGVGGASFVLMQFPLVTVVGLARFPYMLYRLTSLTAYVRHFLGGRLLAEDSRGPRALGGVALALSAALTLPLTAGVFLGMQTRLPGARPSLVTSWRGDVRYLWGERTIDEFRRTVAHGYPRVAADSVTGYYLAGLSPVSTVAIKSTHSPWGVESVDGPERRAAMSKLLSPYATAEERRAILQRYDAGYVAVSSLTSRRAQVLASLDAQPELVRRVVSSHDLVVYRVQR